MVFELEETVSQNARMKVAGVGGGGGNAVNRMIEEHLTGCEFISVNTDAQALMTNQADVKVQIGKNPGVDGVSASMVPVLAGSSWGRSVRVEGFASGPDVDASSRYNEIGPSYFSTLGRALLAGREFSASDVAGAPRVAIVNEAFTRKFGLDSRNAVGRFMGSGGGDELDIQIVGVVQDARYGPGNERCCPFSHGLPLPASSRSERCCRLQKRNSQVWLPGQKCGLRQGCCAQLRCFPYRRRMAAQRGYRGHAGWCCGRIQGGCQLPGCGRGKQHWPGLYRLCQRRPRPPAVTGLLCP